METYRNRSTANLGESGYHAFSLGEVLSMAGISQEEWMQIPMYDSPNQGSWELRKEIAKLYPGTAPENVLVTTGTSEALYLAFHLLIQKGDAVAYYHPAFQALYEIPKMLGARLLPISTSPEGIQSEDWETIQADLYVINHPHNPTGFEFAKADRPKLVQQLKTKNKPVLFDEHYRFLDRYDPDGWTGVSINDRFFGTGSFTKCFGVTGLRIGWLVADESFVKRARSFKDYLTHTVSPIAERIALGLLERRDAFLPKIRSEVFGNVTYLEKHWRELPGIDSYSDLQGGLVTWLRLKPGILSEEYADLLWKRTGVFVLPGKNFEREGFIRLGFGERQSLFQKGVDQWIQSSIYLS
ncbi:putative aspartate aminotransferase [Leptospira ryugenii]|uniref:Aminotransferase n=1 Tax=Leptospira ryugenii TaxID=1917863 RepID=A0A2P2DYL6_9LEPT|nr:putative aspartate aminotransferase [Leptospira ryugenii]